MAIPLNGIPLVSVLENTMSLNPGCEHSHLRPELGM
jgi:hypothetical protein